jgi:hypothetical protein
MVAKEKEKSLFSEKTSLLIFLHTERYDPFRIGFNFARDYNLMKKTDKFSKIFVPIKQQQDSKKPTRVSAAYSE